MNVFVELRYPKQEESTIRFVIQYGAYEITGAGKKKYTPLKVPLPWKIPVKLWDRDKGEITEHKSFANAKIINRILRDVKNSLDKYELRAQLDGDTVTKEGILDTIEQIIKPKAKVNTPTYFTEVFAQLIKESEEGTRLKADGKRISMGMLKRYRLSLWHFENFEEKHGDVTLSNLTKELGAALQKYFNDQNLAHNTKVNHIRTYITVYNYAVEKGWMQPTDFYKIRIEDIEADTIALSEEEVNALFDLKLSGDPQADVVRDTFIIGIWTLMRYGDYSSINEFNIREKYIKYNTTKTDTQVIIPIHWQLQRILEKYDGQLPKAPSEPVFNREIKKIAQRAGIARNEEKREHRGGKTIKNIVPRYQMISSHTARRTGATLLYLDNVPKKQIMMLTGHKKEEHFDRYIRIGAYANAKMLSDRAIFKGKEPLPTLGDDFADGFYWVQRRNIAEVVKIENGLMFFFKHDPLLIETFQKQGGRILSQLKMPQSKVR